jgi:hypothetical protein
MDCLADPEQANDNGAVILRGADPRSDQMSFTATDMNGNRWARAVWPYKQWEHQAAQTVPAGITASDWQRDVMVARVAVELRVDLLVTGSRPILDTALQWITEANPMTAEQALAVVGLYLRGRRQYPMLAPNLLTFGEHQLLWSAARAQLPSGWRWGSALVAHGTAIKRDSPTFLPELSAMASFGAAAAIGRRDPQAALRLIEDSLALTRAGAFDTLHGNALTRAGDIRARTGDLPGALAALQEAALQHHADGTRLFLGHALRIGAMVLARLGEAGPSAVLSGALAAHFPGPPSAWYEDEQGTADQEQALIRHALGEAAYDATVSRGTAMDEDEVVRYAVGEFRRVAALLAEPGARVPDAPPGPASGPAGNDRVSAAPGLTPARPRAGPAPRSRPG